MKKLLSLLLCAAVLFSLVPALAAEVEEGQWYTQAAKTVIAKGIMTGTGHGFAPQDIVTRATVVQTLYNMEGKPQVLNKMSTFPDVQGKWFEEAARWAEQAGLVQGYNGSFNGDTAITRAELVVFLNRYAQYKGLNGTGEANLLTYDDAELISGWAIPAFQWAVSSAVVSGKNGNSLAPFDTAIRAELAQILANFMALVPPADAETDAAPGGETDPLPGEEPSDRPSEDAPVIGE